LEKLGKMKRAVGDVRGAVERALAAAGASASEAALLADVIVEAELRGRPTHGLNRVEGMVRWLRERTPAAPVIEEERGAVVRIDGRDANGYLVAAFMAEQAVRVAKKEGHALVGARNTRHSGMLGYYAGRAASEGVIALMFAHCMPMVAPWGGAEAVLGTNPIAAAFPAEPQPVVIDMGTSATTYGALDLIRRAGGEAPPDAVLDADGRPTRDADAVSAILPFGGPKGYALGLMVQLLAGAFVGAAAVPAERRDYGLFMLAMRPDLFAPRAQYDSGVREVVRRIKSAKRMAGSTEVLIPGERAFRERERRLREGIEISEEQWAVIA
jgi:ureidoglycolate dehydrogenase (NAD+)